MAQPPYSRRGNGAVKSCAYVCSRNSLAALNTLYIVSFEHLGCGLFWFSHLSSFQVSDTVNHQILFNKLEHYGIRGNALQSAFHVGRPEYVRRRLRKMPWRTKEKPCLLEYRRQKIWPALAPKIPSINDFFNSLGFP